MWQSAVEKNSYWKIAKNSNFSVKQLVSNMPKRGKNVYDANEMVGRFHFVPFEYVQTLWE